MAISVLIVIVLIIALVFQQANTAWHSGTAKAGEESALRGIMGVIERDLALAVDATHFGQLNTFSGSSASFVTLDGTNRMPQLVKYSFSGGDLTRTVLQADSNPSTPTSWSFSGSKGSASSILNGSQQLSSFAFTAISAPANDAAPTLPLRVDIEAHVVKNQNFAIVSGWSLGRNRPGHPEDKIVASP